MTRAQLARDAAEGMASAELNTDSELVPETALAAGSAAAGGGSVLWCGA